MNDSWVAGSASSAMSLEGFGGPQLHPCPPPSADAALGLSSSVPGLSITKAESLDTSGLTSVNENCRW